MKVYVCPICDHVMKGKHYCRSCHKFVKHPYFVDRNYSLDRSDSFPEEDVNQQHPPERKAEQKPYAKTGSKVVRFFLVYLVFQVLIVLFGFCGDIFDMFRQDMSGMFSGQGVPESAQEILQEDTNAEWVYEEPEYEQILAVGEESTGLGHFDIQGSEFLERLHTAIADADFEAVEETEYLENYVEVNTNTQETFSYYQNIYMIYLTTDYEEYYRVSEDSVSGRLINVSIESSDCDKITFFTEAAARILFPEDAEKHNRMQNLSYAIGKIFNGEPYHMEDIGNMTFSGYVYDEEEEEKYLITLSGFEDGI